MYAMIAIFSMDPAMKEQQMAHLHGAIVPMVRKMPGFVAGFWSYDHAANVSYGYIVLENEEAAKRLMAGVRASADDNAAAHGVRFERAAVAEIVAAASGTPEKGVSGSGFFKRLAAGAALVLATVCGTAGDAHAGMSAHGFVSVQDGKVTPTFDLREYPTTLPLSVVATIDGPNLRPGKNLSYGKCNFTAGSLRTGTCTWPALDVASLGVGGVFKASFIVFVRDQPHETYYAEFHVDNWAGPPSVFGVPVSGKWQELAKKLATAYGMPLEDGLIVHFAGSSGVDLYRDRIFPETPANVAEAQKLASQAADEELAKHMAELDERRATAAQHLASELTAANKLTGAAQTGAIAVAVDHYNTAQGSELALVDNAVDGAIYRALHARADHLVMPPLNPRAGAAPVVPAEVVAPMIRPYDAAPEGGYCASFLATLCGKANSFVAEAIASRMAAKGHDGAVAAAHAKALEHFPRADAQGRVFEHPNVVRPRI